MRKMYSKNQLLEIIYDIIDDIHALVNPMTTAQDIIVGGTNGSPERLGKGTDGQVLKMVSGAVAWANETTGMTNPMTTAGDIIVGGSSGAPSRLASGTTGQVLKVGSSGLEWANETTGMTNPMTTAGDIIVGGSSGTPQRLAGGTDGKVLKMISGAPAWADESGGGGGNSLYSHNIRFYMGSGYEYAYFTIICSRSTKFTNLDDLKTWLTDNGYIFSQGKKLACFGTWEKKVSNSAEVYTTGYAHDIYIDNYSNNKVGTLMEFLKITAVEDSGTIKFTSTMTSQSIANSIVSLYSDDCVEL